MTYDKAREATDRTTHSRDTEKEKRSQTVTHTLVARRRCTAEQGIDAERIQVKNNERCRDATVLGDQPYRVTNNERTM